MLLLGTLALGFNGMAWGRDGNRGEGSGPRGVREGCSKVSREPGVRATEASSKVGGDIMCWE